MEAMRRSATDTIAAAMEDADGAEEVFIIMTNAEGDIITLSTTDRVSTKIGLLETAKMRIAAGLTKDEFDNGKDP
jgi:hypothetical protein